jgi:hypothetical protein
MLGRAGGFSRRPLFLAWSEAARSQRREHLGSAARIRASVPLDVTGARRGVSFLSDDRHHVQRTGESPDKKSKQPELIMHRMIASLIALSVLAGTVTAAAAATKQDEDRGNFWQQQQDRLP